MDDNFGWEFANKKEYYEPYKKHMPTKQVRLLRLWDEIGLPHDEEKQPSGPSLQILGYNVDANKMTVQVPDEKKEKVVQLLRSHAKEGKFCTVKELQTAAGSVNSALSLYPRIRPRLHVLYDEMAKQEPGTSKLRVTKDVARTLHQEKGILLETPFCSFLSFFFPFLAFESCKRKLKSQQHPPFRSLLLLLTPFER